MLTKDLFSTKFERELHEGAIDNLEARYIDDLNRKMDDLLARARQATDPQHKAALKREYERVKSTRAEYVSGNKQAVNEKLKGLPKKLGTARDLGKSVRKFRASRGLEEGAMKEWLWKEAERLERNDFIANAAEYGMSDEEAAEWWDSINGMDESGIGHDIVNRTEKMARATPQSKAGAVASTVKNAAKWLAGKGGPGKEGPTYEGADDIEDRGEYDREGDMAKDNIHTIVRNARELESVISDNDNLPEWVQDKLANIKGMMTAVSEYMQTQHEREGVIPEGTETQWSQEGPWTKTPSNKAGRPVDPRGEVAHMSDVARRQSERKFPDPAKPYIENGRVTGIMGPDGKKYPMSKSHTIGDDGMIYHWQDPRQHGQKKIDEITSDQINTLQRDYERRALGSIFGSDPDTITQQNAIRQQDREYELGAGTEKRLELKRKADEIAEIKREKLRNERVEDEENAFRRAETVAQRKAEMEKIRLAYDQELRVINTEHRNNLEIVKTGNSHEIQKLNMEYAQADKDRAERNTNRDKDRRQQRDIEGDKRDAERYAARQAADAAAGSAGQTSQASQSNSPRPRPAGNNVVPAETRPMQSRPMRDMGRAQEVRPALNRPDFPRLAKESQKKSSKEVAEHGGGIGPKQHWQDLMPEGFQDFNKVEPYAVCLAGKPVKKFDYYEEARRFHDNWKQKLYREGNMAKAEKITLMPLGLDEDDPNGGATIAIGQPDGAPADLEENTGSWIVYDPATKQIKKRFKTHTAGKSYAKVHNLGFASSEYYFDKVKDQKSIAEASDRVDPILIKALNNMPDGLASHGEVLNACYDAYAMELGKMAMKSEYGTTRAYIPQLMDLYKQKHGLTFNEAQTDFQKRRQRERDVDAGRPVKPLPKNPQTDYARKRAKEKRDLDLFGEEKTRLDPKCWKGKKIGNPKTKMKGGVRVNNCVPVEEDIYMEDEPSPVESAIIRRIMVSHLDWLQKFGPEKVMQAAEEVAYNVGDVDEIGTSDVSAYVHEVGQILGAV